jgi:quercetin dioxygenase-like cupin family protein
MHEPGARETALVTDGTVKLDIAGREYRLGTGDSVTFDADLPHHFENPETEEEARFVSVVSAGLRRS